ncbi:Uncharacterised protein [Mycobacterium tuberculosis]|nr:Uncharacterised protein [Mycobacterium tuberculosis]
MRASRCAVGSSSSSTAAGDPSARARPSRCRCPRDNPTPPRPSTVSSPRGNSSSTASNPAAAQARSRSSTGPSRTRLWRTVPGTSTGRCGSHDSCRHQAAGARLVTSTPATVIRPDDGAVSPAIACSVVLLPAPFRPVSTVTRPGSMSAVRSYGARPSRPLTLSLSRRITPPRAVTVRRPGVGEGDSPRRANALSAAVLPSAAA